MATVLVIEDDNTVRFMVEQALADEGHSVVAADSAKGAIARFENASFDAVITDVNLGDGNGIELVRRLRADHFEGPIVVMTAFASVDSAVEALKAGADEYLTKPIRVEELSLQFERQLERGHLKRRVRLYERLDADKVRDAEPVGESPAWKYSLEVAKKIAEAPVGGSALSASLILGETGSGKGVIARWIHEHSRERKGPFVHVNCSALPPTLVESELFGHEKGAFTDAKSAREGYFEMAAGGTIFLDEIGDMPLDLQAKMLLAVEERRFRRVGGTRDHRVEARVLAATNQDLEQLVEKGAFRRDLLYRLNAVTLKIPPLRERGEDAVLIAERMLGRLAGEYGRSNMRLSDNARAALARHAWPGNVRELMNAMQRVALLNADEVIETEDLFPGSGPVPARASADAGPLNFEKGDGLYSAAEVERALIICALQRADGNVSRAARAVGMQRSSFRYRIDRHDLGHLLEELSEQC